MSRVQEIPEPGQLVEVRQRRYVVTEIVPSVLATNTLPLRRQHLLSLSSVEDDALGEELQVLWELEPGARAIEKTPLPEPTGFDTPQRLDTFLNAVRWGAASSADVKAIQAPFRSGIELEDYQLDPVALAIQMPRANLLIADDVGLGKTIEAGLVAQELIIRQRAHRILIVCPATLQVQWQTQMQSKFGLDFHIVDSRAIHDLRVQRGLHANPWTHFPRLITSIDFLKRERPLRLFGEVVDGKPVYPRKFDLLILDEAHNVAPSGRGKYAMDSLRTQAVRRLTPHFEHRLFLSATPHNGYQESFTALLELLDNQRFARGIKPAEEQLNAIMVRRLKSTLPPRWDGSPLFPRRVITPIEVVYTREEREAHQWLQQYCEERLKRAREDGDHTEQFATEFVAMLLKKRLFSSPAAFAHTLLKHEQSLGETRRHSGIARHPSPGILRSRLEKVEEESNDEEELAEATSAALEATALLFREASTRERGYLSRLHTWAEQAQSRPDSKAQELIAWLTREIRPDGQWSERRVIIFTEYRDTQKWLHDLLAHEGFAASGPRGEKRLLALYGGMNSDEREAIKAAFQAHPADSDVRILLATDAASEGIDLQNYCSRLIHYEIPWNPNRLEQRNGRVDRHGQSAERVDIYHFVSAAYHSQEGRSRLDDDLEFLNTAVTKIEQIREDLGSVGPVIAQQVEEAMLGRRVTLETRKAEESAQTRSLRFYQKRKEQLQERIRQLYDQLRESKIELGMTPENVQAVVEIALELARQPPLLQREQADPHGKLPTITVFEVPDLAGSWEKGTRGLEHQHTRQRRPVVFSHEDAQGRDDVVLTHLNHPLVAMSLRLLRAEIWASGDQRHLNRVTARVVASNRLETPVIIAHARLLVLGSDNQRLHEELIAAGGALRGNAQSGSEFVRFNEGQLREALATLSPSDRLAPASIRARLTELWPGHREKLAQALEARMRARSASLEKALAERAAKEQHDIQAILHELQAQIQQQIAQARTPQQLTLEGFSSDEQQQFARDLQFLALRAHQIDEELEQEMARIAQRFSDPQPRLFPVTVMYLVSERLTH